MYRPEADIPIWGQSGEPRLSNSNTLLADCFVSQSTSSFGILAMTFAFFYLSFDMRKLTHAEISEKRIPTEHIESASRIPLVVLVDNIRSLYNVGSIFRTSDGVMIEKLILAGFTPHPPRKEIDKTALGSTKSVPWEYVKHPVEAIHALKERSYKICCLELTDKSIPHYDIRKSDFPMCLIIGNEITGVAKEVIELCDVGIEIPMFGTKQSLNVAVAYGIAVFELARIWRGSTGH